MAYLFIAYTSRFTLIQSDIACYGVITGQIKLLFALFKTRQLYAKKGLTLNIIIDIC